MGHRLHERGTPNRDTKTPTLANTATSILEQRKRTSSRGHKTVDQ